jgi:hypothetical protein
VSIHRFNAGHLFVTFRFGTAHFQSSVIALSAKAIIHVAVVMVDCDYNPNFHILSLQPEGLEQCIKALFFTLLCFVISFDFFLEALD